MSSGRVVGRIARSGEYWKITADPDVIIRVKRVLPQIRTARSDALFVSDTEAVARELEWIRTRWQFDMLDAHRDYLEGRAEADRERERLVDGILHGTATVVPKPDWIKPALPLRDYQRVATDLIKACGHTLIGDELGIGKTVISLGVLEDPETRPALVVVLTGLGRQWRRELAKFYPQLTAYEVKATKPSVEWPRIADPDGNLTPDLIIINYAKLDSWRHHLAGRVKTVIFDEVQELRRPESLKYQAAGHISDKARFKAGLSATPIYNYGGEIFAVMNVLDKGCLGHRDEFLREWCSGRDNENVGKISVDDPAGLRAHLKGRGLFLRRTLEEVGLSLPPLLPMEQAVPTDAALFDKMAGNAMEVAKLILSQTSTSAERFRGASELDWRMRQATGVAKAPFVADFVDLLLQSEKKILLFGWHRAVYDIWLERLKSHNPMLYTGTESAAGKARAFQEFVHGDSRVLIMSLRSGAGLDGLQAVANTLVFGELDWSPGVHRQAMGRLYRPGQSQHVRAYFCTSDHGSDPVMIDVLNLKAMQAMELTGAENTIGAAPTGVADDHIKRLAADVLKQIGAK
jgi:hypothetical protein